MQTETIKREIRHDLKKKVGVMNPQRKEGAVATAIESQTARIPSDIFLWTAGTAMAASLTLKLMGHKHLSLFIGQWVAPFLLFGVYNKIVKVQGHDQKHKVVVRSRH